MRPRNGHSALAALTLAATLVPAAVLAAPAHATGGYPGETLSLAASGPVVSGQAALFDATGQQGDVDGYAGGFNLEVFAKDPRVDPTCGPDYVSEAATYTTELTTERWAVVGLWQGTGSTFDVPFKVVLDKPGPVLLCAYSTWITDTAATAQLTVDVAGGTPPPPPPPPSPAPPAPPSPAPTPPAPTPSQTARPANTQRPHVARRGARLTCSPGTWSNTPHGYAFAWLVNGHVRSGAHAQHLRVTPSLRSRLVQCRVTASNTAGSQTSSSPPYRVR